MVSADCLYEAIVFWPKLTSRMLRATVVAMASSASVASSLSIPDTAHATNRLLDSARCSSLMAYIAFWLKPGMAMLILMPISSEARDKRAKRKASCERLWPAGAPNARWAKWHRKGFSAGGTGTTSSDFEVSWKKWRYYTYQQSVSNARGAGQDAQTERRKGSDYTYLVSLFESGKVRTELVCIVNHAQLKQVCRMFGTIAECRLYKAGQVVKSGSPVETDGC